MTLSQLVFKSRGGRMQIVRRRGTVFETLLFSFTYLLPPLSFSFYIIHFCGVFEHHFFKTNPLMLSFISFLQRHSTKKSPNISLPRYKPLIRLACSEAAFFGRFFFTRSFYTKIYEESDSIWPNGK